MLKSFNAETRISLLSRAVFNETLQVDYLVVYATVPLVKNDDDVSRFMFR